MDTVALTYKVRYEMEDILKIKVMQLGPFY